MLGTKIFGKLGWQPAPPAAPDEPLDQIICVHYENGVALATQDLHLEAIKEFRRSIANHWNSFEAHYELGKSYQALGQMDKAIKEFRTALRFSPNHIDAHNRLGLSYDAVGNSVEAIK